MKLDKYIQNQNQKLKEIEFQISRCEKVKTAFPNVKFEIKESSINLFSATGILFHCEAPGKLQKYICSSDSSLMNKFIISYWTSPRGQSKVDLSIKFNIFPYFSFNNERIFLSSCFVFYPYKFAYINPSDFFIPNHVRLDQKLQELKLSQALQQEILIFCHSVYGKDNVSFNKFLTRKI